MINEIMTKIEHVFSDSAEKTFGTYERTFENKTNTNKNGLIMTVVLRVNSIIVLKSRIIC